MTNSTNWAIALQLALKSGWNDQDITDRLHELVEVIDLLCELYAAISLEDYLNDTVASLNDVTVIEAIRLGRFEEILGAIEVDINGSYT